MSRKIYLEFAAKAAGYKLSWSHDDSEAWLEHPDGVCGSRLNTDDSWDPLTDDGDAFRLAAKLNMIVSFLDTRVESPVTAIGEGIDKIRVTREAIVLAAVVIGRDMP